MKKVTAYTTSDGKLFRSIRTATCHETEQEFSKWYSENELLGNYAGSRVDLSDIKDWLDNHKEQILKYLTRNN